MPLTSHGCWGNRLPKPKNTPRSKRLSRKLCKSCASAIPHNQRKHSGLLNVALVAKLILQQKINSLPALPDGTNSAGKAARPLRRRATWRGIWECRDFPVNIYRRCFALRRFAWNSSRQSEEKDAGDVVLAAALLGQVDQAGAGRLEGRSAQDGNDFVGQKVAREAVCGQEDGSAGLEIN